MEIPSSDFYSLFRLVVAPEFKDRDDTEIDAYAAEAKNEITEFAWGKRYPRAIALLVAHMMSVGKKAELEGSTGGQVKRVKVGDLEREFNVPSLGSKNLSEDEQTRYIVELLRLRKQLVITPQFIY